MSCLVDMMKDVTDKQNLLSDTLEKSINDSSERNGDIDQILAAILLQQAEIQSKQVEQDEVLAALLLNQVEGGNV